MHDLPIRGSIKLLAEWYEGPGMGSDRSVAAILRAYADGRLIDRDTINYKAAAKAEHEQWIRWAMVLIDEEPGLSQQRIDRWAEYLVPYEELEDDVKEFDRIEARRCLAAAFGIGGDDE